MSLFHGENLDKAIADELFEDINDHYHISEDALIRLDRQPDDSGLFNELFRSVHTIKGDLGVVGFSPALPLINAIEDLLGLMRSGSLDYTPLISDLLLLVLDRIRAFVDEFRNRGLLEYDQFQVDDLSRRISSLGAMQPEQRESAAAAIIRDIDPSVAIDSGDSIPVQAQLDELVRFDLGGEEDLDFFRQLIVPVEERSRYWVERCDRILRLALILNQLGGSPVDEKQLAAAVYVHDFGMAFMPLELLHKQSVLSNDEIQLLRSHVQISAHLLQHMPRWAPARDIVLQHHEAANGTGYPFGLREREICPGAKILAIADTFDAMTHSRAYSSHQKRPIIRAVKEINDLSGRQLATFWVEIFNQAVQPVLLAHRAKHF